MGYYYSVRGWFEIHHAEDFIGIKEIVKEFNQKCRSAAGWCHFDGAVNLGWCIFYSGYFKRQYRKSLEDVIGEIASKFARVTGKFQFNGEDPGDFFCLTVFHGETIAENTETEEFRFNYNASDEIDD